MNILIGNQKGGVGKSTLCILLANYLSFIKKKECLILDMDFQSSISNLWERDQANFDNTPPYEVLVIALDAFSKVQHKLKQVNGHVLIDLPGKIDDNLLIPVYQSADLVICPFAYDKITFESTATFAQIVRHLNAKTTLLFIPNRLKAGVRYNIKAKVNKALSQFGRVLPELGDRVAFQRIDTISLSDEQVGLISKTFDPLFENYLQH